MIRLHLTSGRGPAECRIALALTLRALEKEAHQAGIEIDIAHGDAPDNHGPGSAIVVMQGETAENFARSWTGSIQWQFKSPVRPNHKRKNWFVGVTRLPMQHQAPASIKPDDVTFDTFRAGGPGGQHQNTTDSAVRAVHKPTGLSIVVRSERSQHRNKAIALTRLATLLEQARTLTALAEQRATQTAHDRLERGKPVRTFTRKN